MTKTLADFMREARARIREISVEGFDEMIENHDDVLAVDVREAEEFHREHFHRCAILLRSTSSPGVNLGDRRSPAGCAPGARRIRRRSGGPSSRRAGRQGWRPWTFERRGMRHVDKLRAADTLQQMGFQKVCLLVDGIDRWEAAGLALAGE